MTEYQGLGSCLRASINGFAARGSKTKRIQLDQPEQHKSVDALSIVAVPGYGRSRSLRSGKKSFPVFAVDAGWVFSFTEWHPAQARCGGLGELWGCCQAF